MEKERFSRERAAQWIKQTTPLPSIRRCAEIWGWSKSAAERLFREQGIAPKSNLLADPRAQVLIDLSNDDFVRLLKARYERKKQQLLAAKAEVAAAEKLMNDLGRRINGHL